MKQSPVTQAVASAALSLVLFVVCVGAFLPPFVERTTSSVPLIIAVGLGVAVTFSLHVAFVGIAAHRAGRSAILWSVLAVLVFPVGSIVGLVLFEWFSNQAGHGVAEKTT